MAYQLNCDDYVFYVDDKPVRKLTTEVAIVFGFDPWDDLWCLHKHGSPESMHQWLKQQETKIGKDSDMFKSLHVMEGKLPIDALNKCIQNSNHIKSLIHTCQAIVDNPDFHGVRKTFLLDGNDLKFFPFDFRLFSKITDDDASLNKIEFGRKNDNIVDISDVVIKNKLNF